MADELAPPIIGQEEKPAEIPQGPKIAADSPISQARKAGYTDDQINSYLTPRWEQARQAGYSDAEISEHLGITPRAPEATKAPPQAFIERYIRGTKLWQSMEKIGSAFKEGFEAPFQDPFGFPPEMEKAAREAGIWPQPGEVAPLKFAREQVDKGVLEAAQLAMRTMSGLGTGLATGLGKATEEVTGSKEEGNEGARFVMALQNAMAGFGTEPFARVTHTPEGKLVQQNIGTLPTAEDFRNAGQATLGQTARHVDRNVEATWQQAGVHPAEIPADAAKDVTISQDLAAINRDVPQALLPKPKEGEAPKESGALIKRDDTEPAETGGAGGGKEPPKDGAQDAEFEEVPRLTGPAMSPEEAQSKVLSRLSIGEERNKEPVTWDRLYTALIDDLNPIKTEVANATGGKRLPVSDDPYSLMRLTRGTYGKADQMLERGTFDFNSYKTNGPGLRDIMAPVAEDLNGFRAYAAAKRDIELTERGIKTGIDHQAAQIVVNEGKGKYEPTFRKAIDYQNRLSEYLRDSGVISREGYKAMREANKQYVPFFRLMEPELNANFGGGSLSATNPIKKIKGSERKIIDPLESVIKNTYAYIHLAEKNAAGLKLIDALGLRKEVKLKEYEPAGDIAPISGEIETTARKELPAPEREEGIQRMHVGKIEVPEDAKEYLKDFGIEGKAADDLYASVWTANPSGEYTIRVLRDGKPEEYRVSADLARAWRGLDRESMNFLTKMLAIPARALRAGATLSPDFITRNPMRDIQTAFINSRGIFSPVDFVKGFLSLAKRDEHFQNWLKGGGANSAMVSLDRQYLQENLFKLNNETGVATRSWNVVDTVGKADEALAGQPMVNPFEFLRLFSETMENSTRIGEFRKIQEMQAKRGEIGKPEIQKAAMASRELTLDFAKMGAKTRAYNMISAFAAPTLNGTDRMIREAYNRPFNFAVKSLIGSTIPATLLWWATKDDPDVQQVPRWQKDMFYIFPLNVPGYGKVLFRFPRDFTHGIIFGALPTRLLDAYVKDNPDAMKDIGQSIENALLPGLPTIMTPLVEQFANTSMLTGGPIVPSRLEKGLPEYQYTPYTTETAKAIGSVMGAFPGMKSAAITDKGMAGGVARALTSPALIENYVRAWTGGMGTYVLQVADQGLKQAKIVPDLQGPTKTLADIPVIKAFTVRYPSASAVAIQDFYDEFGRLDKSYQSIRNKAQEGDAQAIVKILGFTPEAMLRMTAIQTTLSQHEALIKMVNQNPSIAPEQQRQIIDTTYYRMIEIAKGANTVMRQATDFLNRKPATAGATQ